MRALLLPVRHERAQLVIDELAGRMRACARLVPLANRIGYVRRLRDLELAGGFIPELAFGVQSARLRRREDAARHAHAADAEARQDAAAMTPEARARGRAALDRIQAMFGMTGRVASGAAALGHTGVAHPAAAA